MPASRSVPLEAPVGRRKVKMQFINLGWCMAKLESNLLVIVSPSDGSEGIYSPAESIRIFGKNNLEALRDALNAEYPMTPNAVLRGEPLAASPLENTVIRGD